ncbi:hypothetical protein BKA70DRAFT_169972 [Coprinopsis sp. MPI-PUGE-AT-0042]|nr:hypothetical protein BKA70DRAFT_169972 [Coprinopsis sp. MPI-PUGE-AT-0042]
MHQSHNIPWSIFNEHTKFVAHDPAFFNRPPQLVSRGKPGEAKALNHFVRTFTAVMEEFSATERKKYPPPSEFKFPTTGKLFIDDLKAKYPEYLNDDNQRIEYWIERRYPGYVEGESRYDTSNAKLAEVVKVLMTENEMETLLMLANHPQIPLYTLCNLHWGHHFGFSRVMESALDSYLFFNITSATGDLANGNWRQMRWFESLLSTSTHSMDFPAQQIPHKRFFALPDHDSWAWDGGKPLPETKVVRDLNQDYKALHEYLKLNFELLYRYNMLLRELGVESPWQGEITRSLGYRVGGLKVHDEYDEETNKWRTPVFC